MAARARKLIGTVVLLVFLAVYAWGGGSNRRRPHHARACIGRSSFISSRLGWPG